MTYRSHIVSCRNFFSRCLASWLAPKELSPTKSRVASGEDDLSRLAILYKPDLAKVVVTVCSVPSRSWSTLT